MKYVRIDRVWAFLDVAPEDFEASTDFWTAITGTVASARRGDRDQFLTLLPETGAAVLKLQRLTGTAADTAAGPSRLHLDLDVTDRAGALESLISEGARLRGAWNGVPALLTPAGQVFCVTVLEDGAGERAPAPAGDPVAGPVDDPVRAASAPARVSAAGERVAGVVLKIARDQFAAEVDFWRAATDCSLETGPVADSVRLRATDWPIEVTLIAGAPAASPGAVGGGVVGGVVGMVIIAARDLAAATERHLGLGARLENQWGPWTVLIDPTGRRYALTPWC